MTYSEINNLRPIYYPTEDNLDSDLFLPVTKDSCSIDCMVGYFTSGSLLELAQALVCFFNSDLNSKMRLIVSPNLMDDDVEAISEAISYDKSLIPFLFPGFSLDEKTFRNNSVRSLCYLVASGRIEIKVALKDDGLFHTKCWIFNTSQGDVAIHGSGNATKKGLSNNFEQIVLSRSWKGEESEYICKDLKSRFHLIWDDSYEGINCKSLNQSTINEIKRIKIDSEAKDIDEEGLIKRLRESLSEDHTTFSPQRLAVPSWLNYQTGNFKHQGEAIQCWVDNKYCGIMSIATGGGKTLTSLTAASLLNQFEQHLLVVIAVPTAPLLGQWEDEVKQFSVKPFNTYKLNRREVKIRLRDQIRRLKHGASKTEVIIVTHDSLSSDMLDYLGSEKVNVPVLLIGDEVHNLGSEGFRKKTPDYYKYRIGLSATHERQFDEEGSNFLLEYFGGLIYEYSLEEAIGNCLVPFEYFVHTVYLTAEEEDRFAELTAEIKKLSFASNNNDGDSAKEAWKLKCLERRRVIEAASNKVKAFSEVFPSTKDKVEKTLIFCTDKYPDQIIDINHILNDRYINFHQITQDETSKPALLRSVLDSFNDNVMQVLTSKRVLDEGFNVPQTETAYLIASNTVRRQWIQRLGRTLRLSPKTGKTKATIHDFIVLPVINDETVDSDLLNIIEGEYRRITFFSKLSKNGLEENGSVFIANQLLELMRK